MSDLLVDLLGFEWVDTGKQVGEFVYERDTGQVIDGHPVRMRIYSSIDRRTEVARNIGRDAIRVVLMWNGRMIGGTKRVNRVENWARNLMRRINAMEEKGVMECVCGSVMVEKRGRYGRFMGCSTFPKCRHTCEC